MKKNRVLRLGLLALVLTLVTASLVSGTLAKYVTTVNGTGAVTVAKWHAKVGADSTNTYTSEFYLFSTIDDNTDVVSKKIAPGTKGSFALSFETTGTEVDHKVFVSLKQAEGSDFSELGYLTFTVGTTNITAAQLASGVEI